MKIEKLWKWKRKILGHLSQGYELRGSLNVQCQKVKECQGPMRGGERRGKKKVKSKVKMEVNI